jgi:hypothetical protein
MDISLLKSMFAGNVGTKPTSLKSVASPHTKQPTTIPAGDVSPTNTGKTVTTDNSQIIAQNESVTEPSKDFRNDLGKKIMIETSRNAQANKKRKTRDQSSRTFFKMAHPAESLAVQGVLTRPVVLDKTAGTIALNRLQQQAESQIQGKSARSVVGSNLSSSPQTPFLIAGAAKPITSEPDQIVSTTTKPVNKPIVVDKVSVSESPGTLETNKTVITSTFPSNQPNQQSGKESTPKTLTSNKKTTTDSEQSVVTNKPFLPDSPKTQLSDPAFAASSRTHTSDEPAITTRPIANPSDGRESIYETYTRGTQMTVTGEKPVMVAESALPLLNNETAVSTKPVITSTFPSNQPNQQSGKESNHKTLVSNNKTTAYSEQSVVTNKPFVPDSLKTPLSNATFAASLDQLPTLPASMAFAKTAGNTDAGDGVGEQIQESIHSSFRSGSQHIVIRLNPPELGKVSIKFAEQGDDINGLLQVDRPQTRDQIQQVLPEIMQNLADLGIAIKKLEVVLTNQQDQYILKDQSSTTGQDNFFEQQSSPNSESQGNSTTYNQWLRNIDNVTEFTESQIQLTDGSINMLV